MTGRALDVRRLGRVPYAQGLELQRELVTARRDGAIGDTLLLLEHDPVVTLGRGGDRGNLLLSPAQLAERGIEFCETERGGDVTFHGPGQLVGYPVLALRDDRRDAHRYLRDIEGVLLRTFAELGVRGERAAGLTGVWVGRRKLAAIGVRLSAGWITSHGFSINVDRELAGFDTIVPCGLAGRGVVSLNELLDRRIGLDELGRRLVPHFAERFDLALTPGLSCTSDVPG